jgi:hypothetical protein
LKDLHSLQMSRYEAFLSICCARMCWQPLHKGSNLERRAERGDDSNAERAEYVEISEQDLGGLGELRVENRLRVLRFARSFGGSAGPGAETIQTPSARVRGDF